MTSLNPSARIGLVLILVLSAGVIFAFSACPPLDLFYQLINPGGTDYEKPGDDSQDLFPQLDVYIGTFTPGGTYWRVTENQVEIKIERDYGYGIISGTGKQVLVHDPEDSVDQGETITYNFRFEGTYEPDINSISGVVHITGGKVCTANCDGVDNYDLDFYSTWTASLSEDGKTLLGHVDQMGDYGDFTANK